MRNTDHTHSIEISAQQLVTAAPDGRCWLVDVVSPGVTALRLSKIAAEHASLAASLVEGAVSAGLLKTRGTTSAGSYTLPRYIRWLAGNYIFAGQTPGLFRRGAERFDAAARLDLAELALKKAAEETGHAELAYRDLEALGLPAAEVVQLVQPPSVNLFVERFRSYVESSHPIALFGFSYCLERMAVERDAAFVRNVEAICPPGSRASHFLRVHSNTGSDGLHVHEQLAVFESFGGTELAAVVRAAYETAELLAHQPLMDAALSDEEICRLLRIEGIAPSFASGTGEHRGAITEERKLSATAPTRSQFGALSEPTDAQCSDPAYQTFQPGSSDIGMECGSNVGVLPTWHTKQRSARRTMGGPAKQVAG